MERVVVLLKESSMKSALTVKLRTEEMSDAGFVGFWLDVVLCVWSAPTNQLQTQRVKLKEIIVEKKKRLENFF